MNSILPFFTVFCSTLLARTLLALSASHWFLIWISLELNLLSFIPLVSRSSNHQETEASIKYFLVQATGSALLLFSILWSFLSHSSNQTIFMLLFFTSLLLKLGAAPLHFWFPNVMAGFSWIACLVLSTWQKIIPLSILLSITASSAFLVQLRGAASAIIGGIGGINQTFLRPLLAYSSIGHIGWILAARMLRFSYRLLYFVIYCIILIPLIILLNSSQLSNLRQSSSISSPSSTLQLSLLIILLSLGGLPPLLGFLSKWIVIEQLMSASNFSILLLLLLLGSLINLFYYLNVTFSLSMVPARATSENTFYSQPISLLIFPSLFIVIIVPLLFCLL